MGWRRMVQGMEGLCHTCASTSTAVCPNDVWVMLLTSTVGDRVGAGVVGR